MIQMKKNEEKKTKNEILEEKVQEIRDNLNNIDDILDNLDDLVDEEEPTNIKNLDNFICKLKVDNLYTPELERFIEQYMKYYND